MLIICMWRWSLKKKVVSFFWGESRGVIDEVLKSMRGLS